MANSLRTTPLRWQSRVIVTMEHCDRKGSSKVLSSCTLPITGIRCVSMLVTDKAVFDIDTKVRPTARLTAMTTRWTT